jgi:hypothetical protein
VVLRDVCLCLCERVMWCCEFLRVRHGELKHNSDLQIVYNRFNLRRLSFDLSIFSKN